MYCSTSLAMRPIVPRLPRGLAFLLILSLLLQTYHLASSAQPCWLLPVPVIQGYRYRRKGRRRRRLLRHWCLPGQRWQALLPRLLTRCALLTLLLQASGWARVTPLRWSVLLVPVGQTFLLDLTLTRPHGWTLKLACLLQRLYQLELLILLLSTLGQLLHHPHDASSGLCFPLALGTWHTSPDEGMGVSITTLSENHYQITLRGTFSLTWEAHDDFERRMLILFLRQLQRPGTWRPCLTQRQVAEAFDTKQCLISHWEKDIRQRGWHFLSDRPSSWAEGPRASATNCAASYRTPNSAAPFSKYGCLPSG